MRVGRPPVPEKPRKACTAEGCVTPAMPPAEAKTKLGHEAHLGLCPLHTLRAAIVAKAQGMPKAATEYHDAAPYTKWVSEVAASGTLTYKGLTVNNLKYTDLTTLTGVHRVTFSRLNNGHLTKLRKPVVNRLNPFVMFADAAPRWPVEVGTVYPEHGLKYAPLLTVIVDHKNRAWQLRGDARALNPTLLWSPAHTPETRPSRAPGKHHAPVLDAPAWPAKVVWLPSRVQTTTTR